MTKVFVVEVMNLTSKASLDGNAIQAVCSTRRLARKVLDALEDRAKTHDWYDNIERVNRDALEYRYTDHDILTSSNFSVYVYKQGVCETVIDCKGLLSEYKGLL